MSSDSTKNAPANQEENEAQPNVGTDPMELPQDDSDGKKKTVTLDKEKVAQHDHEEAEHEQNETPAEHAERIKNA